MVGLRKFWQVAKFEYRNRVFRKRFVFILFALPALLLLMIAVSGLFVALEYNLDPVGFVDYSGVIKLAQEPEPGTREIIPSAEIRRFENESDAMDALEAGTIQGFYVIPEEYMETGTVELTAKKPIATNAETEFLQFLKSNLLAEYPEHVVERLTFPNMIVLIGEDESRSPGIVLWISFLVPLAVSGLFTVIMNINGGYLFEGVVEEKGNRTIELMATSTSPDQLMLGKLAGNIGAGLTQLAIWLAVPAAGVLWLLRTYELARLLSIRQQTIWLMLGTFIPALFLYSLWMMILGVIVAEPRVAQLYVGLFSIFQSVPYLFIGTIVLRPDGTLPKILSFFPLTAPLSISLRSVFDMVPAGQVLVSLLLLYAATAGSFWFTGRAFRLGMLRYGKKVSIIEIFARKQGKKG